MPNKIFYDSPKSKEWHYKFGILFIKKDHRRILNAQPQTKEIYQFTWTPIKGIYFDAPETKIIHDFKILSN